MLEAVPQLAWADDNGPVIPKVIENAHVNLTFYED